MKTRNSSDPNEQDRSRNSAVAVDMRDPGRNQPLNTESANDENNFSSSSRAVAAEEDVEMIEASPSELVNSNPQTRESKAIASNISASLPLENAITSNQHAPIIQSTSSEPINSPQSTLFTVEPASTYYESLLRQNDSMMGTVTDHSNKLVALYRLDHLLKTSIQQLQLVRSSSSSFS